jgi:ribonuclease Z
MKLARVLTVVLCAYLVGSRAGEGSTSAKAAEPVFRVTLLGTGNPRPSINRFGPSTLVEAGALRLLIDAGRGASIRLFQIGGAEMVAHVDAVLFTHLHSDHVVGFPDLWLTGWIFGRRAPLVIRGPSGTVAMVKHLGEAYDFDITTRRDRDERLPETGIAVDAADMDGGVVLDREGVKVTAFAVDHGPVAPAYGFRVEYAGRSVVISGDTREADTLVEAARGTDVLVHEVLSPEVERRLSKMADPAQTARVVAHHITPEQAGRVFARVKPRLAVFTHIVPSPAGPEDLIPPTRKTYQGRLVVGFDLMVITIGEQITVGRRATLPE